MISTGSISLGKGEVDSSILSGSTIQTRRNLGLLLPEVPVHPEDNGGTERKPAGKSGENPGSDVAEAFSAVRS